MSSSLSSRTLCSDSKNKDLSLLLVTLLDIASRDGSSIETFFFFLVTDLFQEGSISYFFLVLTISSYDSNFIDGLVTIISSYCAPIPLIETFPMEVMDQIHLKKLLK